MQTNDQMERQIYEEEERVQAGGKRQRKEVDYSDTLNEKQWLRVSVVCLFRSICVWLVMGRCVWVFVCGGVIMCVSVWLVDDLLMNSLM